MIEVALQWDSHDFAPLSQEDLEKCKEFKIHQIVKAKISGVKKPRSYLQLKMFHGVLRTVALALERSQAIPEVAADIRIAMG